MRQSFGRTLAQRICYLLQRDSRVERLMLKLSPNSAYLEIALHRHEPSTQKNEHAPEV